MAVTYWLVRHGQTQSNVDRIFQGQLDIPLNEHGIAQAKSVANELRAVDFAALYASDLSRAADTAREIARYHDMQLHLDARLRELHYGVLQGIAYDQFPEVLARHGVRSTWGDGLFSSTGIAAPDGESQDQLRERLESLLSEIESTFDMGENVLLVAHGGALRTLMTLLLGLPPETRSRFVFENCSVTRITRRDGVGSLELHNAVYS